MSSFPLVTINNALQIDRAASLVTVLSNANFILAKNGTSAMHAVTYQQLTALSNEVVAVGNLVGSTDVASLSTLISNLSVTGVVALNSSISQEVVDRLAGEVSLSTLISVERSERTVAVDSVITGYVTANNMVVSKLFKDIHVPLTKAVYGNYSKPMPIPLSVRESASVDGWYFSNNAINSRIAWNLALPKKLSGTTYSDLTYGDIDELNLAFYNASADSITANMLPYLELTTSLPNGEAFWTYKYQVSPHTQISAPGKYLCRVNLRASGSSVGTYLDYNLIGLGLEIVNDRPEIQSSTVITHIRVNTHSVANTGSIKIICNALQLYTAGSIGNYMYVFKDSDALNDYNLKCLDNVYATLGQTNLPSGLTL
jgi:hypothetical protein